MSDQFTDHKSQSVWEFLPHTPYSETGQLLGIERLVRGTLELLSHEIQCGDMGVATPTREFFLSEGLPEISRKIVQAINPARASFLESGNAFTLAK